jgi:MerR family transcriptional regulator/heat shock protein HspR
MAQEDAQIYVISIAAELAGMHPQTLRQYDRLGLVSPGRARGRGRRYSLRDIATLREVQRLSHEEGINLAGIKRILDLEAEVDRLSRQVEYLRAFVEPGRRVFTAHPSGDVVAMGSTGRSQRRRMPVDEADRRPGALVLWRPLGR